MSKNIHRTSGTLNIPRLIEQAEALLIGDSRPCGSCPSCRRAAVERCETRNQTFAASSTVSGRAVVETRSQR
jgi:hypothetical protein